MDVLDEAKALLQPKIECVEPSDLSLKEEESFQKSVVCYMCSKAFSTDADPNLRRVRDHDHFNGNFIGAAHSKCNLARRKKKFIPLFAHNFSGYDSHFVVQALAECKKKRRVSALAYNTEKIRSISIDCFKFLDSADFISGSLGSMVQDLSNSAHNFPLISSSGLDCGEEEKKKLLIRKGVFPYDLLKSVSEFNAMTSFPDIACFKSVLSGDISPEDYLHGKKVFEEFECKNMVEYMVLYNKLDVMLLAEALFSFREMGMKYFKLDMMHFISLPQFALECMLYQTKAHVELIHDVDMLLFVEKGIRGGLSYASRRYAETDHKRGEECIYIDANNLVIIYRYFACFRYFNHFHIRSFVCF
jgi:hypothetical protein